MKTLLSLLSAGLLALAMTTADVSRAEARGRGNGVLIGLGAGLLIGGLIASHGHARARPRVHFQYAEPVTCYAGPTRCRWERVCDDTGFGDYYCHKVQHCFRPQICE